MFKNLFPKEFDFFDSFNKQVDVVVEAAEHFKTIVTKSEIDEESRKKMRDIEHRGDDITYKIIDNLNKTFITPFDREDIHSLAKKLDDVNDIINTLVSRMIVYKLDPTDTIMVAFADIIDNSVKQLSIAVKGLNNMKNSNLILKACVEVNRYESQGDKLRDRGLTEIFEREKDPLMVIKWKEIYQISETALDICKYVGHVVEAIMVKQA